MLPQQPNLNVIERKFKRQILKPDPIILEENSNLLHIGSKSYDMKYTIVTDLDNILPDNNTEQRTDVPGEARVKHDSKECINTIIQ